MAANVSGAIRAGRAFIELLTDDRGMAKGLASAQARLRRWSAAVTVMGLKTAATGTAIMAPLVASGKAFASAGDQLEKASRRTGVAVEELSLLAYAASQSGADLGTVETGLKQMSRAMTDAARGTGEATEAFAALGLSAADMAGRSQVERFKLLADRIANIEDPAIRAGVAMKIFGRSGTDLLPLFDEGAAGIQKMIDRGKALGLQWSTKDAKAAAVFTDAMDDMWRSLKRAFTLIGASVTPILKRATEAVTAAAGQAMKWVDANRQLFVVALQVGAGLTAAGVAMVGLGVAMAVAAKAMGLVSAAMVAIKAAALLMVTPVGLVVAAIGGIGALLATQTETGRRALAALAGYFGDLRNTATDALGGIRDALAGGDWKLAAEIAWVGLKIAFQQGIQPLKDLWGGFTSFFMETMQDAIYRVQIAWEKLSFVIGEIIQGIRGAWSEIFAKPKAFAEDTINTVTDVLGGNIAGMVEREAGKMFEAQAGPVGDEEAARRRAHEDRLAALSAEREAVRGIFMEAHAVSQEADKLNLDELRARLEGLRRKAEEVKAAAAIEPAAAAMGESLKDMVARAVAAAQGALSGGVTGITSRGTFNAAAWQSLQSAGPNQAELRTAKATEATASLLRQIFPMNFR